MSKLTQNITNAPRSIKGLKPTAYWAYRSDLTLTIVDNKVTAVTAAILGVIEGCKFFMNGGGEQVVADDNFSGFKQKFNAVINVGSDILDSMDNVVLFVESNEGVKYVLGAKYGLWKTSQAQMANDNLAAIAVEFTSREGMEETASEYLLIADISSIPITTTLYYTGLNLTAKEIGDFLVALVNYNAGGDGTVDFSDVSNANDVDVADYLSTINIDFQDILDGLSTWTITLK